MSRGAAFGWVVALVAACAKPGPPPEPDRGRSGAGEVTGPLACPPGTTLQGELPPVGTRAWCATAGGVSHGPFMAWYDDGQKKTEGTFRHGSAYGRWRHWHPTGALRTEGEYRDGEKVGTWPEFDAQGRPLVAHDEEQPMHVIHPPRYDPPDVRSPDYRVGVAACDEYRVKMRRCITTKMPEAVREELLEHYFMTLEGWEKIASGKNKLTLADICKVELERVEKATTAVGCDW